MNKTIDEYLEIGENILLKFTPSKKYIQSKKKICNLCLLVVALMSLLLASSTFGFEDIFNCFLCFCLFFGLFGFLFIPFIKFYKKIDSIEYIITDKRIIFINHKKNIFHSTYISTISKMIFQLDKKHNNLGTIILFEYKDDVERPKYVLNFLDDSKTVINVLGSLGVNLG